MSHHSLRLFYKHVLKNWLKTLVLRLPILLCKLQSCWYHSCTGMESCYGYLYIRIGFLFFWIWSHYNQNCIGFSLCKRTFGLSFDIDFFRILFWDWVCAWLFKTLNLVILILIKRIQIQNPMGPILKPSLIHVHNTLSQDSLKIVLQLIKIN
jgi:hypothetical protein